MGDEKERQNNVFYSPFPEFSFNPSLQTALSPTNQQKEMVNGTYCHSISSSLLFTLFVSSCVGACHGLQSFSISLLHYGLSISSISFTAHSLFQLGILHRCYVGVSSAMVPSMGYGETPALLWSPPRVHIFDIFLFY